MKENRSTDYAFIDSQNLNLAIRDQGWRLDFKRFRIHLHERYGIKKAYLFLGFIPKNQKMYDHLINDDFILIFKPVLENQKGKIKGNIDAELVLHSMIEFPNYDQAVIVTGDGDFYCLIDYLNKKNKLLRLLVPNVKKYSKLLKSFAPNKIDFMNNLKKKLEYKKPRGRQLHKD